ncbi:MAG: FAD-dependent oxidoreductase, partial [Acidiferrobacterales bacterium]
MKIIIIGAGAGGASVATRARRLDERAEIILVDKNAEISQATCGLPYSLGNIIRDRSKLVVVDSRDFSKLVNVDVRTRSEVISIARKQKSITIRNLVDGNTYEENYDKLVLSPGGVARLPDIAGIDNDNVFTLQSLSDLDAIKTHLSTRHCKNATVIGAGFIGLEVADNLYELGIHVSIVELSRQVIGKMDFEMASIVHQHLKSKNINLILQDRITEICEASVTLASGLHLNSDIVIVGLGVVPAVELAIAAGIKIGDRGGIAVSDTMVTSDVDIYALGDSVEMLDHVLGRKILVQLAGPAHKQASVVAANILGNKKRIRAFQGTSIAKVFDLSVAMTGASEKQLKASKVNYSKSYVDVPNHATYYPNAYPLTIKLLFNPDGGEILGAQVVGVEGVDKRIDLISTAIHFNRTIYDLAELELAYAPPYSSAKDPINIAGMVARNMLEDNYQVTYWDEMPAPADNVFVLDVRTPEEYELGAIHNSTNIPLEELRDRLDEIPKDKQILIYC